MSSITAMPPVTGGDAAPGSRSAITDSNEEAGERFLKLLVTQLKNQDPMNPMDNAQLTSQMAQINTVAGIEKLNKSVGAMTDKLSAQLAGLDFTSGFEKLNATLKGLSGQFLQSQTMQGAGMVGRQVWVSGNTLSVEGGQGTGAFELARAADAVTVEVLSPGGHVVGQLDLGAKSSGRSTFSWSPPEGVDPNGLTFRIQARAGAESLSATPQSAQRVQSVVAGADGLVLNLSRSGPTPISGVKAWS